MIYKSAKENFADEIIRLIETQGSTLNAEQLGLYTNLFYKKLKFGLFDDYSVPFGLYTDVDNV